MKLIENLFILFMIVNCFALLYFIWEKAGGLLFIWSFFTLNIVSLVGYTVAKQE
jgi:hypothetical protein